jgi:hypothetical protein
MLTLALLCCSAATAVAQPPAPPKPNPQAPVLTPTAPMGTQKGTAVEFTVTGKNLADPTGLLIAFPCKSSFPKDDKAKPDPTKLKVRIEVPPDAPLGFHALRLATNQGMSNPLIFCVDELPQVLQVDNNRDQATPQAVPVPCVVAGHVDNLKSSFFKISVKAGQRLSFEVIGRRLGSPLDPQLFLLSAKTGQQLAYDNNAPGLQTDARLTYTFAEAGDYLIKINDVLNRGGADYCFRLRIGDFPCATLPIPLAAKRGSKVSVAFAGPEVAGVPPVEVVVPADPAVNVVWVAPRRPNSPAGWPVALLVSDLEEKVEQEPNDELAKANRLVVPGAITGRLDKSGDKDFYVFTAKKGDKLLIQAHTIELYSPTLVYFVVKNAKGNELAKTNPDAAPPLDQRLEFTVPDNGDYFVEVQHLNFEGGPGPSEAYRLTVTPSVPSFDLTLALDRWDVHAGGALLLPITVARTNYAGPIEVQLVSTHPGVSGQLLLDGAAKTGSLLVLAKEDVPPGPYALRILGKATINGQVVSRWVSVRGAVSEALADLPFPPLQMDQQLALAVTPKTPFSLAVAFDQPETVPGLQTGVTITIKRTPGFDEPISLLPPEGLPGKVNLPALKPATKGQDTIKFALPLDPKVTLGKHVAVFRAKAKVKTQEIVSSAAATLVVSPPFTIQGEPAAVTLKPGTKIKLLLAVPRKGGYQGPINLEVRNLPPGVQATKATLNKDQPNAEIEISALPNAAVGERKDVNILGVAPAAGNQQSASANFVVSVSKL